MKLHVIEGIKKKTPDYDLIYKTAFYRCIDRIIANFQGIEQIESIEKKRIVFYGVKMINTTNYKTMDYDDLFNQFKTIDFIKIILGTLTPHDLENIFPIDKDYDGDRYGTKDYFFTKKAIREIGEHELISEKVDDLIWDYQNRNIRTFEVNSLYVISSMRRFQGEKGLMEEFCEQNGITTYTMHEGKDGKEYLTNNDTNETVRVKKPIPRYLSIVPKK